jgi:Skp family chaperone for outer membrane proteins
MEEMSKQEAEVNFSSPVEEAKYWREKAIKLEKETKDVKEEFQEFQEGSRELEAELETQLEQSEHKVKEYRSLSNRLQMENDQLKSKLEQCHREYHFQEYACLT